VLNVVNRFFILTTIGIFLSVNRIVHGSGEGCYSRVRTEPVAIDTTLVSIKDLVATRACVLSLYKKIHAWQLGLVGLLRCTGVVFSHY